MEEVVCEGISEVVYDENLKEIGRTGFHDYDGWINIMDLRERLNLLAVQMKAPVHCFATAHGYHIITFKILNRDEHNIWKLLCRKLFKSNYVDDLCDSCLEPMEKLPSVKNIDGVGFLICKRCGIGKFDVDRVLRIGEKLGKRPRFLCSKFPKVDCEISRAHYDVYEQKIGLPNPDLFKKLYNFRETKVNFCQYTTVIEDELENNP